MKMHQVKTVIVDEADQLVSREHVNTVGNVIKSTLKERQLLFFSATHLPFIRLTPSGLYDVKNGKVLVYPTKRENYQMQ